MPQGAVQVVSGKWNTHRKPEKTYLLTRDNFKQELKACSVPSRNLLTLSEGRAYQVTIGALQTQDTR